MRKFLLHPARLLLAVALCGLFIAIPVFGREMAPPKIHAVAAVMIEAETGKVLYATNPDMPFPPASLTKLMTLQLALHAIEQGKLSLDQEVVPVKPAWATSMPPRSSLMFLGPDQRLTVRTLLRGLIVDSGNDAAYEIAYLVAGSVPAFAAMMNQEAKRLGFTEMHFVEPSGISSRNRITAMEYAEFCRYFIRMHPETLADIFSVKEFAYPQPRNLTNGTGGKPIVQYNRNLLLWSYPGTDGLKTGYIDQSGYNMAVTAQRDGMRLISVVLGVRGEGRYDGEQLRAIDEERLLNWGFSNFVKVQPAFKAPSPVHVWKGARSSVSIAPYRQPVVVLDKAQAGEVKVTVEQVHNVIAPVYTDDTLGKIVFTVAGKTVRSIPLVAAGNVSVGGVPRRVIDSLVLFARGVLGLPRAETPSPPPPISPRFAQVAGSS